VLCNELNELAVSKEDKALNNLKLLMMNRENSFAEAARLSGDGALVDTDDENTLNDSWNGSLELVRLVSSTDLKRDSRNAYFSPVKLNNKNAMRR
jgi:hypothetical protein